MANNYNIKSLLSQPYFIIIYTLVLAGFAVLLLLDISAYIKIILGIFLGFMPLFFIKPVYFLYFIFVLTPSIRVIAKTETIWQTSGFSLNLNAMINFFIIFFGAVLIMDNWREAIAIAKKNKFLILFLLFIFLAAASLYHSLDKQRTVEDAIRLLSIFILLLYSFLAVKDKNTLRLLLTAVILGALAPALTGLYQLATGGGWYDKTIFSYRINGTFLHPATFAFYLLFSLPILYGLISSSEKKPNKLFLIFTAVFFIFLIAAGLTRGAWLGLLAMLLTYGIFRSRKFLAGVLIMMLMAYLLIPAIKTRVNDIFNPKYNSSFTTRLTIIKTAFPAFAKRPFFGYGLSSFENIHLEYNPEALKYESQQAHNDYLRILIELGFFGLALYAVVFLFLFWRIVTLYRRTNDNFLKNHLFGLIILWLGALAVASGDNILRTMEVQYLLWAYTGAVLAVADKSPILKKGLAH